MASASPSRSRAARRAAALPTPLTDSPAPDESPAHQPGPEQVANSTAMATLSALNADPSLSATGHAQSPLAAAAAPQASLQAQAPPTDSAFVLESDNATATIASSPASWAPAPWAGWAAVGLASGLLAAGLHATTPPAPRFAQGPQTALSTPENTPAQQVIYTARAQGASAIVYVLAGGPDDTLFTLDAQSGELRWKSPPDFEHPASAHGDNHYTVAIGAKDAQGQVTVLQLSVQVTDVDDSPPRFPQDDPVNVDVPENTSSPFYTALASDNVAVTGYALVGGADAPLFALDPHTGQLRFKTAPDFEHPSSAAGSNRYSVQLQAVDAAGLSAIQTVMVNVTDVDDTPPQLQSVATDASGQHIALTFNEPLRSDLPSLLPQLSVQVADTERALGTAQIAENTLWLTLVSAVGFGQNITLSYTPPPVGGLQDAAHNTVPALRMVSVHNAVPAPLEEPPPAPTPTATPPDTTAPVFSSASSVDVLENTPASRVVLDVNARDNGGEDDAGLSYRLLGADAAAFELDTFTGALRFISAPNYEAPSDVWRTNRYHLSVTATDRAGNTAQQDLTVQVSNEAAPASANNGPDSAFTLWQTAEDAWLEQSSLGSTRLDLLAYQRHSTEIAQERDNTSRDGFANSSQVLTQWIDQVQGSDIVSEAAYAAGLRISGQAAAGAQTSVRFRLDADRTDGIDGQGAQVLQLGDNDIDHDGHNDVTASYDNATGAWSLAFTPRSHALQPATHNVYGSGVHQLVVDTDGNGHVNDGEASRLFLVADGTATASDSGQLSQNYSTQDSVTGDVFVYYYGDPDGPGTAFWSPLDSGDSPSNTGLNTRDKDGDGSDWDYYTSPAALASLAPASASNTALHLVTDIAPQLWAYHMANVGSGTWDVANALVQDHVRMGSNTSRMPSLQEWLALYAANFGGDDRTLNAHTVGPIEPMSDAIQNDASAAPNWRSDNRPAGWDDYANEWGGYYWAAAPTPRGHAQMWLGYAQLGDSANPSYAAAVL